MKRGHSLLNGPLVWVLKYVLVAGFFVCGFHFYLFDFVGHEEEFLVVGGAFSSFAIRHVADGTEIGAYLYQTCFMSGAEAWLEGGKLAFGAVKPR